MFIALNVRCFSFWHDLQRIWGSEFGLWWSFSYIQSWSKICSISIKTTITASRFDSLPVKYDFHYSSMFFFGAFFWFFVAYYIIRWNMLLLKAEMLQSIFKRHSSLKKSRNKSQPSQVRSAFNNCQPILTSYWPKEFICYVNNNLWSHWISIYSQNIYAARRCSVQNRSDYSMNSIGGVRYIVNVCSFLFLPSQTKHFARRFYIKVLHQ